MGADLRMGLDPRDAHADVGMILGDGTIEDNPIWPWKQRDRTCLWLDFIDPHFDEFNITTGDPQKATNVIRIELDNISIVQTTQNNVVTLSADETTVRNISTRTTVANIDDTIVQSGRRRSNLIILDSGSES